MNGWMDEWMDGWMDRLMHRWMDKRTDGWKIHVWIVHTFATEQPGPTASLWQQENCVITPPMPDQTQRYGMKRKVDIVILN